VKGDMNVEEVMAFVDEELQELRDRGLYRPLRS
jgi:hypothetical protein